MSTLSLQDALDQFRKMDDKQAADVAHTYLLGVLEADRPEDVQKAWTADFSSEAARVEADKLLRQVLDQGETRGLLRLAVETTVEAHPDTATLFIESVESSGEKMWMVEVGFVALVAAHLLREFWRKGKSREIVEETKLDPDGNLQIIRKEIVYVKQSGALANLVGWLLGKS